MADNAHGPVLAALVQTTQSGVPDAFPRFNPSRPSQMLSSGEAERAPQQSSTISVQAGQSSSHRFETNSTRTSEASELPYLPHKTSRFESIGPTEAGISQFVADTETAPRAEDIGVPFASNSSTSDGTMMKQLSSSLAEVASSATYTTYALPIQSKRDAETHYITVDHPIITQNKGLHAASAASDVRDESILLGHVSDSSFQDISSQSTIRSISDNMDRSEWTRIGEHNRTGIQSSFNGHPILDLDTGNNGHSSAISENANVSDLVVLERARDNDTNDIGPVDDIKRKRCEWPSHTHLDTDTDAHLAAHSESVAKRTKLEDSAAFTNMLQSSAPTTVLFSEKRKEALPTSVRFDEPKLPLAAMLPMRLKQKDIANNIVSTGPVGSESANISERSLPEMTQAALTSHDHTSVVLESSKERVDVAVQQNPQIELIDIVSAVSMTMNYSSKLASNTPLSDSLSQWPQTDMAGSASNSATEKTPHLASKSEASSPSPINTTGTVKPNVHIPQSPGAISEASDLEDDDFSDDDTSPLPLVDSKQYRVYLNGSSKRIPRSTLAELLSSINLSSGPATTYPDVTETFLHTRQLRLLERYFSPSKPFLTLLYGSTTGKTRIARAFFSQLSTIHRYQHRLWINCTSHATATASIAAFLHHTLGTATTAKLESLLPKLCAWLQSLTARTLIVLDGARNGCVLQTLFRGVDRFQAHVLVTCAMDVIAEDMMAFVRKSGGESLLVPMGFVSAGEVAAYVSAGQPDEAARVVPRWVEGLGAVTRGDAYRSAFVKGQMEGAGMSGRDLFTRVWAVQKTAPAGSWTRKDVMRALLDVGMNNLVEGAGRLGEACVGLLEAMSVVTSKEFPVSASLLKRALGVIGDGNRVVEDCLVLLASRCLIVRDDGYGDPQFYVMHDIQTMLLEDWTFGTASIKCVHNVLMGLYRATSEDAARSSSSAARFLTGCDQLLIYLQARYKPETDETEEFEANASNKEALASICSLSKTLGVALLKDCTYQQAMECFQILANTSEILVGFFKGNQSEQEQLRKTAEQAHDLSGCIAALLVAPPTSTTSNVVTFTEPSPHLQLLFSTGTDTPYDHAANFLLKSLTALQKTHQTPSIELARIYSHLAYVHGLWAFTYLDDAAVPSSPQDAPSIQARADRAAALHARSSECKAYALCAVAAFAGVYGTYAHVDVVGASLVCATAYVLDGDRMQAWLWLRRAMQGIERVFGVVEEDAFEGRGLGGGYGNEFCGAFSGRSLRMLVETVTGLSSGEAEAVLPGLVWWEGGFGVESARRMYRRCLLAAGELARLHCGDYFKSFVVRYMGPDVRDGEDVEVPQPMIDVAASPEEADDIDDSDSVFDPDRGHQTPSEASDIPDDDFDEESDAIAEKVEEGEDAGEASDVPSDFFDDD
ncbi:hypothetical protein BC830DRAFT_1232353 [Chytriomyces sp. MP71]|nr:hypothetical protein BC830DRAFT_1232353 [Chytriomyces sp. MP71]